MPLNNIHRKCTVRYKIHKSQEKNQPPHVHGRHQIVCQKFFKVEILIQAARIYSQDIGIEFGIEKCSMLIMNSRKRQMMEEIELPNKKNGENQNARKKGNLQALGNIGSGSHQTCRDERKKI